MKIHTYILLMLISLSCISCMKPFDLRMDDEPVIFLEAFPGVENVVVFNILPAYSHSNTAARPEFRPKITFTVNGTEIPVSANTDGRYGEKYGKSCYIADYMPLPGDKMSVVVASEGFRTISAHTRIPEYFPERKIDYRQVEIGERTYNVLYVTFDDDASDNCAYGLQILKEQVSTFADGRVEQWTYGYGGSQISEDFELAPESFDGRRMGFDGWTMRNSYNDFAGWDDVTFNGEEKTLSMVVETFSWGPGDSSYESFFEDERRVERYDEFGEFVEYYDLLTHNKLVLYTMSEEFYKYAVAQELINDNADFFAGIAPSNFCYSNIIGGYGAFAGVCCVETDWITKEFIENNR